MNDSRFSTKPTLKKDDVTKNDGLKNTERAGRLLPARRGAETATLLSLRRWWRLCATSASPRFSGNSCQPLPTTEPPT